MKRLKCAEHKIFCLCIDVFKQYEDDDINIMFEALSKIKKN